MQKKATLILGEMLNPILESPILRPNFLRGPSDFVSASKEGRVIGLRLNQI